MKKVKLSKIILLVLTIPPQDVHAEYAKNGYITVSKGVNAVNISMWINNADSVVYLLTP